MKYNPQIHHRRSIRLKGYDYSQAGAYFITICCHDREYRFGNMAVGAGLASALVPAPDTLNAITDDPQMELNQYGIIAYHEWVKLPERFHNVELDVFQIMPNHMHGIIILENVGAGLAPALSTKGASERVAPREMHDVGAGLAPSMSEGTTARVAPTSVRLGDIIGAYKSLVANACLEIYKSNDETMGKLWQRNYHEHIIRDQQAYLKISEYIRTNPLRWMEDKFYTP